MSTDNQASARVADVKRVSLCLGPMDMGYVIDLRGRYERASGRTLSVSEVIRRALKDQASATVRT